jgi:hypothetical protein
LKRQHRNNKYKNDEHEHEHADLGDRHSSIVNNCGGSGGGVRLVLLIVSMGMSYLNIRTSTIVSILTSASISISPSAADEKINMLFT